MTDLSLVLDFRRHLKECTRCPISSNTGGPIPWSGDVNPTYAIMGEAPGRTEAQYGKPFVGDSGNILRHWLRQVGIDPSAIAYLNSCACWPSRNPPTPTREELTNCRPWVNGQLEFIRPKILITLGVVAFNQLRYPATWPKLAMMHGKPYKHPVYDFWIFSSYHPASYLRGRSKKYEKLITEDLAAIANWDGLSVDECYACGDEVYNYDEEWKFPLCYRHSMKAGILFPEDIGVTT